jgi:hypothetical protein
MYGSAISPLPESFPHVEDADFPTTGSRARRFARFERDLAAWLQTGDGMFARWTAERPSDPSAS